MGFKMANTAYYCFIIFPMGVSRWSPVMAGFLFSVATLLRYIRSSRGVCLSLVRCLVRLFMGRR